MLTLPRTTERAAQPFVAVRRTVRIPFDADIAPAMAELFDVLRQKGIEPSGPVFFKYNIIRMPELEIDFAVPVAASVIDAGSLVSGILPPGRYAELTYWGHYDNLMDANAVLIGWAKEKGIAWDAHEAADGDHFACRMEIYPNGPDDEPDPAKWETTVAIKVKD
ncbi:GyrI-like domain-containing protein [Devosia sp.]|uniref:GyrI-like domain-containing protein n=1 Tax=Devosia sp. TaxID=1871048 RepID=UPI0035AFCF8E